MRKANIDVASRVNYIDMAKGLSIMCIIWCHNEIPLWFNNWMFSFHVPIFFIISGYFYTQKSIVSAIKDGWIQLVRPLLVTVFLSVLLLLVLFLKKGYYDGPPFFIWMKKTFTFTIENGIIGMWFLAALFYGKIILAVFLKYLSLSKTILVSLLIFVFSHVIYDYYSSFPFYILFGMSSVVYLVVGYLIKHFDLLNRIPSFDITSWILVVLVIWQGYKMPVDCSSFYFPKGCFSFLSSVIISISVVLLFKELEIRLKKFIAFDFLGFYGKNSLVLLCFHGLFHVLQLQEKLPFNPLFIGPTEIVLLGFVPIVIRRTIFLKEVYRCKNT